MNIHKQHLNNLVCSGLALLSLAASDANAVGSTPVTITNPVTAVDIAKAIQSPRSLKISPTNALLIVSLKETLIAVKLY